MEYNIYSEGTYSSSNPTWHEEDSSWKAKQILRIMKRNNCAVNSICEIGCGAGEILHQLYLTLDSNVVFHGYEVSSEAYELCKIKENDRLKYMLKDSSEIEDNTYDLLLCIDVFEHVENYFDFLRTIRVKAEYKVFHIPLDLSASSIVRNLLMEGRDKVGHLHYFTKDTALAALKDCGYEILDYNYTAGALDLPSKTLKNMFARLPRYLLSRINQDFAVRLFGGWSLLVLTK